MQRSSLAALAAIVACQESNDAFSLLQTRAATKRATDDFVCDLCEGTNNEFDPKGKNGKCERINQRAQKNEKRCEKRKNRGNVQERCCPDPPIECPVCPGGSTFNADNLNGRCAKLAARATKNEEMCDKIKSKKKVQRKCCTFDEEEHPGESESSATKEKKPKEKGPSSSDSINGGGKPMACTAQNQIPNNEPGGVFPKYSFDNKDRTMEKNEYYMKLYSVGRTGEVDPSYTNYKKAYTQVSRGTYPKWPASYDILKAQGFVNVPEGCNPKTANWEECRKNRGGSSYFPQWYVSLGNDVPSPDYCLKAVMSAGSCLGMKTMVWINTGYKGGGECICSAGSQLVNCNPWSTTYTVNDDRCGVHGCPMCSGFYNESELSNAAHLGQFSLSCTLPKPGPTDYSTISFKDPNWNAGKIPVCSHSATQDKRNQIQDWSEKSILIGKFGTDPKGRAACADESWKNKECNELATRLSFSTEGECRCEWGPLIDYHKIAIEELNGHKNPPPPAPADFLKASQLMQKWNTCLYPRNFLKQGKDGEAFAMKYWGMHR